MNLWELKRGWTFRFDDRPPGEMFIFLGMDGMYAKVRAMDPVLNKEMCLTYDSQCDFFAIATNYCEVILVDPLTGYDMEPPTKGERNEQLD